jgi:hypothetical protein
MGTKNRGCYQHNAEGSRRHLIDRCSPPLAKYDDQLTTLLRSATAQRSAGVDLISDALPFGRLWYGEPNTVSNAIGYAKFFSRSHNAVIRVYDEAGNVLKTHNHKGDFRE